jgi:hypothetical protein
LAQRMETGTLAMGSSSRSMKRAKARAESDALWAMAKLKAQSDSPCISCRRICRSGRAESRPPPLAPILDANARRAASTEAAAPA